MAKLHMHLHDGRMLDLSGLTVDDILARLAAERVTPEQVRVTYHVIERADLEADHARSAR